jgi:polyisoprenoid-binding protein YceI
MTPDITRSFVEVSIDASSIDTGVADRDTHLRSPDFFDVEKFPELHFRSTRIEPVDDSHYRVMGDLTIRGVKREVALDAEYGGRGKDPWGNERIGFVAKTSIDRKGVRAHLESGARDRRHSRRRSHRDRARRPRSSSGRAERCVKAQ